MPLIPKVFGIFNFNIIILKNMKENTKNNSNSILCANDTSANNILIVIEGHCLYYSWFMSILLLYFLWLLVKNNVSLCNDFGFPILVIVICHYFSISQAQKTF